MRSYFVINNLRPLGLEKPTVSPEWGRHLTSPLTLFCPMIPARRARAVTARVRFPAPSKMGMNKVSSYGNGVLRTSEKAKALAQEHISHCRGAVRRLATGKLQL